MAKQIATVGGGCFWCTEAIFQEIQGVEKVVSGYTGGNVPGKPTYREICSGLTGHAEVVQITYDSGVISYEEILTIFITTHDPTTLNRQGADIGTQYRSSIFFNSQQEKNTATTVIEKLQPYFNDPIVTTLEEFTIFYPAEEDHQDFYKKNTEQPYCTFVINPKLSKLKKLHSGKLKKKEP